MIKQLSKTHAVKHLCTKTNIHTAEHILALKFLVKQYPSDQGWSDENREQKSINRKNDEHGNKKGAW